MDKIHQIDGYWIGNYGNNGHELVDVKYNPEKKQILAMKVTGDKNVPGGELSFYVQDENFGKPAIGCIQIAHIGFHKPRWIEGSFHLKSSTEFEFSWNNIIKFTLSI
eukprot:gene577-8087_t